MQKFVKATYFHNDEGWLARHGDRCWDTICDMPIDHSG